MWQGHVKLVSPEDKAQRDLGNLPGMPTWSFNALLDNINVVRQCKSNKVDDAWLNIWACVDYAM